MLFLKSIIIRVLKGKTTTPLMAIILLGLIHHSLNAYSTNIFAAPDQSTSSLAFFQDSDYSLSSVTNTQSPTSFQVTGENILVLVNSDLYDSLNIRTSVNTYIKDLNDTGYTSHLYTSPVSNASDLRSLLQNWYVTYNISGAVLVGYFPYIRFYHDSSEQFPEEVFICDLYLMDLDGRWQDLDSDGIFDQHDAGQDGDIFPEIYIGRIDASFRTLGGLTNEQNICNLLSRLHSYRTGSIVRNHRAITYIDDDWEHYADDTYDYWPGWLNGSYNNRTEVHSPPASTNAYDWLNNRLTQNYEWAHLCAHSSPNTHYFGPDGYDEGTVTSSEINSKSPSFNFYNLFCCSAARWTTIDCLATTYLFSGSHSLAVVASTKTGGMLDGISFYDSLGMNNTLGQALHDWFRGTLGFSEEYLSWFYGMCVLGDPFLTIHYDYTVLPVSISSSTHPDSTRWYASTHPQINWTEPPDVNNITGYYYILDQNPSTIPTALNGVYSAVNGTRPFLTTGIWYLHVVAIDGVGNIGKSAAHYQLNIEKIPPVITLISPVNNTILQSGTLIDLEVMDKISGLSQVQYNWDDGANMTLINPFDIKLVSGANQHVLRVFAYDNAGNWGFALYIFTVESTSSFTTLRFVELIFSIGTITTLRFIKRIKQKKRH